MDMFSFVETDHFLGEVLAVDTRKVLIQTESEPLRKARVGRLVAIKAEDSVEHWLIGQIDRVVKKHQEPSPSTDEELEDADYMDMEPAVNHVRVILMGSYRAKVGLKSKVFSRATVTVPSIEGKCYLLENEQLQSFMQSLEQQGTDDQGGLMLGHYSLDPEAKAFLNGNKFFQRHAAILGSTGSGKSYTVARVLEAAAKLKNSNLIVFDLHGEYHTLDFAQHYKIAGPDDLEKEDDTLLYLPYWMLDWDELVALFLERPESTAQNQATAFRNAILAEKQETLDSAGQSGSYPGWNIDTPIPFSMNKVIGRLRVENEEKGNSNKGKLDAPILRMERRLKDKRYGFMNKFPETWGAMDALGKLATHLMGLESKTIKVIDFSDVPAEARPIIVGLVARLVFQLQFWSKKALQHPIALLCDEAHLYLPRQTSTQIEEKSILGFERIAKEGRKYGVALVIVSQRPADVSETILSQANNVMALRLTNINDQNVVKRLMPESLENFMDLLPMLETGEVIVVGDSVLLPSRVKVQEPECKPDSMTRDFWDEWSKETVEIDLAQAVENLRKQSRL